jgi:hypothetical protein
MIRLYHLLKSVNKRVGDVPEYDQRKNGINTNAIRSLLIFLWRSGWAY